MWRIEYIAVNSTWLVYQVRAGEILIAEYWVKGGSDITLKEVMNEHERAAAVARRSTG
jgi:hypothetical protein